MAVNQERGHVPLSVYHSKHSIPRAILFFPALPHMLTIPTPLFFFLVLPPCVMYTVFQLPTTSHPYLISSTINKFITLALQVCFGKKTNHGKSFLLGQESTTSFS
jgi:hypothetical protein